MASLSTAASSLVSNRCSCVSLDSVHYSIFLVCYFCWSYPRVSIYLQMRTSSWSTLKRACCPWLTLDPTPTDPRYVCECPIAESEGGISLAFPVPTFKFLHCSTRSHDFINFILFITFYNLSSSSPLLPLPGWTASTWCLAAWLRAWRWSSRSRVWAAPPAAPVSRSPSSTVDSSLKFWTCCWLKECYSCNNIRVVRYA